jgi:AmmeMemoRadiSam system protein A
MNDQDRLTIQERSLLLAQARLSIEAGVHEKPLNPLDLKELPEKLRKPGAVFVTLTIDGNLRGCVGALEAYQPLVNDVREHAFAAAFHDFRFPPVRLDELDNIEIEISRLTTPQLLVYKNTDDLLKKLRPGIDGVVLKVESRRATFLPQVWEKLSSPDTFLDHLCQKMGVPANLWRHEKLEVLIYQVEEFHE